MTAKARLGRPPASNSAETKGRILAVARTQFAELGIEATTNRAIASKAGITTGAIYHYFDSKLDIYLAVLDEVQQQVHQRFSTVDRTAETFVGKIAAMLEVSHQLNRDDPSLAQFLEASRIDARRNPELAAKIGPGDRWNADFLDRIVDTGVTTGEIAPEDRDAIISFIRAFTIGLIDGMSHDPEQHQLALEGITALLEGRINPPPTQLTGRAQRTI